MSATTDPDDPRLRELDLSGMQRAHLVLPPAHDVAAEFVRPVRRAYVHATYLGGCGAVTTMATSIAESYARQPDFYGSTWCVGCREYRPVGESGEFVWDGPYGLDGVYETDKVGT